MRLGVALLEDLHMRYGWDMNKVLLTGLALGSDVGVCQCTNVDYSWLVNYPSALIWADKLLITSTTWKTIQSRIPGETEHPALAQSLRRVCETADANGLVEVINPPGDFVAQLGSAVWEQVDRDRAALCRTLPGRVVPREDGQVPGGFELDGVEFCAPEVATIYGSLALARIYNATCLFGDRELLFLRAKSGLAGAAGLGARAAAASGFSSVFQLVVPDEPLLPHFALGEAGRCAVCAHESECGRRLEGDLDARLSRILEVRDYDEVHQMKAVVASILSRLGERQGILEPEDVRAEYRRVQTKLRRRMYCLFPKVTRWCHVTTFLSTPIAVLGVATGALPLAVAAGALAAGGEMTRQALGYLQSKYSWVAFRQQHQRAGRGVGSSLHAS